MDTDEFVWFRTDTNRELMETIEFTGAYIAKLPDDLSAFRWSVIGSVLSLQGACIFQLDGNDSSGTAVLGKKSQKLTLEHLNQRIRGEFPLQRLAPPAELLKRVRSGQETLSDFSSAWSHADQKNCEYLISLRNEFVHFIPQGWSHALNGYSEVLRSVWGVVMSLLNEPISYMHRIDDNDLKKMQSTTLGILDEVARLETEL